MRRLGMKELKREGRGSITPSLGRGLLICQTHRLDQIISQPPHQCMLTTCQQPQDTASEALRASEIPGQG